MHLCLDSSFCCLFCAGLGRTTMQPCFCEGAAHNEFSFERKQITKEWTLALRCSLGNDLVKRTDSKSATKSIYLYKAPLEVSTVVYVCSPKVHFNTFIERSIFIFNKDSVFYWASKECFLRCKIVNCFFFLWVCMELSWHPVFFNVIFQLWLAVPVVVHW